MPNKCDFDYFWELIIYPAINYAIRQADIRFVEETNLAFKEVESYKKQLRAAFLEKRNWLKKVYLPHESSPRLDFHKLSAIMCRIIIANKPIVFDVEAALKYVEKLYPKKTPEGTINQEESNKRIQWFTNNVYINYCIAFYVSVGVIHYDLYMDSKDNNEVELSSLIKKQKCLKFYPKSSNHERYEHSMILALMKNDMYQRDFDYLGYAANMYQLQQFNLLELRRELTQG